MQLITGYATDIPGLKNTSLIFKAFILFTGLLVALWPQLGINLALLGMGRQAHLQ